MVDVMSIMRIHSDHRRNAERASLLDWRQSKEVTNLYSIYSIFKIKIVMI